MKAVERWENEGGSVSPLNSLWEPLKNFRTEDKPREDQVIEGGMIVSRSSADGNTAYNLSFRAKSCDPLADRRMQPRNLLFRREQQIPRS